VQNAPTALAYGKAIEAGGLAIVRGITLTADDRLRRELIERLMCDLDVDVVALAAAHEADPTPLAAALAGLAPFAADGLADWTARG